MSHHIVHGLVALLGPYIPAVARWVMTTLIEPTLKLVPAIPLLVIWRWRRRQR